MSTPKNASKSRENAPKTFPLNITLAELINELGFNMPYSHEPVQSQMLYTNGRFILSLELTDEQAKRLETHR